MWAVYNKSLGKFISEPMTKTKAKQKLIEIVNSWRGNFHHTAPKNFRISHVTQYGERVIDPTIPEYKLKQNGNTVTIITIKEVD